VDQAFITPDVARWARQRVGLTEGQLADELGITSAQVLAWEAGESRPQFGAAQKLAQKLRVPFGYLFLSNPPEERTPLPDLRTVQAGREHRLSVDFVDLLNDVIVKQNWYREYLEDNHPEALPFVGRFASNATR
jgi:transcriptional regulator with XRE-family HTH domain